MKINTKNLKSSLINIEVSDIIKFGNNLILESTPEYTKEIVPGDKITYKRIQTISGETQLVSYDEYEVSAVTGALIYVALPSTGKTVNVASNEYQVQQMKAFGMEISGDVETLINMEIFYRFDLDDSFNFVQSDIINARNIVDCSININVRSDTDYDYEGNLINFTFDINHFYSDDVDDENSHYIYIKCTEAQAALIASTNCYIITNYNNLYCARESGYTLWDQINSDTTSYYSKDNASIKIGLQLDTNTDFSTLFQEEHIEDIYNDRVKSQLIPDLIDMERVRYVPHLYNSASTTNNGVDCQAEKLNFHIHLRHREMEKDPETGDDTFVFSDNWYINNETDYPMYWNTYADYDVIRTVTNNYYKSDPIGFLNFTDNDILYQKTKVKKSFIRLSFYNDNTPGSSSLLFYSTLFFDSNELYSKLLKLKTSKDDIDEGALSAGFGYTLYSASTDESELLTCGFSVSNTYDKTKSSDGYNLYLFRDDAPLENTPRTIYMKVEFNHAGYGRTVPLIMWPFDEDGNPQKLKMSNYFESLYIPVEIQYINNKYVYTIKGARNNLMDGEIDLPLFEPKFQPNEDTDS